MSGFIRATLVLKSTVPIILLIYFIHYLNYSANEGLGTCYSSTTETGVTSLTPIDDYVNVTEQWRTLMLLGIVWSCIDLVIILIFLIVPQFFMFRYSFISTCIFYSWLIAASIATSNTSGTNCSQTPELAVEGMFLKNLTYSFWGITYMIFFLSACIYILLRTIFSTFLQVLEAFLDPQGAAKRAAARAA